MKSRRELWWQYAVRAAALHERIKDEGAAIVPLGAQQVRDAGTDRGWASDNQWDLLYPNFSFSRFAEMCSLTHNSWAWEWGSTLKSDLRYNPSDVFDIPLQSQSDELAALGRETDRARKELMLIERRFDQAVQLGARPVHLVG